MTFFYNSDVRLAMYVMFDLLCVMFDLLCVMFDLLCVMIDLLYVRVGILLICGNHLDDRYQVKSAPGHFGTYLHSQIGTYSNRHLSWSIRHQC